MFTYLTLLLIFFGIPLVLMLLFQRRILSYRRTILWALLFVYTIGFFWDWLSVRTGVWRYDSAPTLGLSVRGIPLEESAGFYILGTLFIVAVASVMYALFKKDSGAPEA